MLEDWIWHAVLPMLSHAALGYASVRLARVTNDSLIIVGGSALLLVLIGIHNAWDTVTYVMMQRARARKAEVEPEAATVMPGGPAAPKS